MTPLSILPALSWTPIASVTTSIPYGHSVAEIQPWPWPCIGYLRVSQPLSLVRIVLTLGTHTFRKCGFLARGWPCLSLGGHWWYLPGELPKGRSVCVPQGLLSTGVNQEPVTLLRVLTACPAESDLLGAKTTLLFSIDKQQKQRLCRRYSSQKSQTLKAPLT